MTFKHVKFQDSAVMRSLEKVAREKGLVKEQDLVKTASITKKADLTPSSTLTANLIKLSVGLREAGFDKYADEVETKFMAFKQADTLYQTSKEKGEDLVEEAHPKGSHKLEGVDADEAVFETILDQHLQNIKMIDKMPTGKLASSAEIVNAVKMVLGQDWKPYPDPKPRPNYGPTLPFKLDLGPAPKTDPLEMKLISNPPWSDGNRANARYISETLGGAIGPLGKVVTLLDQLAQLASDDRFPKEVAPAVKTGKEYLVTFVSEYMQACKSAFDKARALELQRLKNVDDIEQSKVTFSEVGGNFKTGHLGKSAIGKANSFTEILSSLNNMKRGLGNLIYDKFSPGFDFDEPYMQSVKNKANSLFSEIRSALGGNAGA